KVFCQPFKNEPRYYILYQPALDVLQQTGRETFKAVHDDHWQIECFHRVIKQVCNIERFYVRDEQAIRNHFFCALRAFCQLQTMCINGVINNCYEISRQLFVPVIRQFILEHLAKSALASPHLGCPVNA
ncbi:MAG: transposase, partial [Cyanobacteria bacterium J06628_6]